MNNKMAIHIYQQLNLKTNYANKNRDKIMNMEDLLMVARWERRWGSG